MLQGVDLLSTFGALGLGMEKRISRESAKGENLACQARLYGARPRLDEVTTNNDAIPPFVLSREILF